MKSLISRIYTSPYIFRAITSRRMKLEGHTDGIINSLVGKTEGKRPNGGPNHRWIILNINIYNIK
jgi:hypothetical protein